MSKWLREQDFITLVLVGLCALLALFLAGKIYVARAESTIAFIATSDSEDNMSEDSHTTMDLDTSVSVGFPPLARFSGIVERPLFNNTRRPVQTVTPGKSSIGQNQLLKRWRLKGVVLSESIELAIIQNISDKQTVKVKLGMTLDQWVLENIASDHIVLALGVKKVRLPLYEKKEENEVSSGVGATTKLWKPN